jgi:uncharacterized protein YcfJ
MNPRKILVGVVVLCASVGASADVVFFQGNGFGGRSFTANRSIANFANTGFNDRASSAIVRNGRWEVCEDSRFRGRCVTLRPGSYGNLSAMGLNNRVSSVRPLKGGDREFASQSGYDYRRRNGEQLFQAPVVAVHGVFGPPEQRCWVEQQQVHTTNNAGGMNVPGAIIGGILGGVLGHQIGGGRGQDVATGVGAVSGALIGSNVGNSTVTTQNVQRCATVPSSGQPTYWDVTYEFGGYQHQVQLTSPPGPTILVNQRGEPRM